MSLPARIILRFLGNAALVWVMITYLPQYLSVTGGWFAIIAVGALLTLLNLFLRPILSIVTLPLRLIATLVAAILVNSVFFWVTMFFLQKMDPARVSVTVKGGITGWLAVACIIGFWNWLLKETFHADKTSGVA